MPGTSRQTHLYIFNAKRSLDWMIITLHKNFVASPLFAVHVFSLLKIKTKNHAILQYHWRQRSTTQAAERPACFWPFSNDPVTPSCHQATPGAEHAITRHFAKHEQQSRCKPQFVKMEGNSVENMAFHLRVTKPCWAQARCGAMLSVSIFNGRSFNS